MRHRCIATVPHAMLVYSIQGDVELALLRCCNCLMIRLRDVLSPEYLATSASIELGPESAQAARLSDAGRRAKEDVIEKTEHRCIDAEPERHGDENGNKECRCPPQRTERVAHVIAH